MSFNFYKRVFSCSSLLLSFSIRLQSVWWRFTSLFAVVVLTFYVSVCSRRVDVLRVCLQSAWWRSTYASLSTCTVIWRSTLRPCPSHWPTLSGNHERRLIRMKYLSTLHPHHHLFHGCLQFFVNHVLSYLWLCFALLDVFVNSLVTCFEWYAPV